jgi:hypothetical protein
MKMEMSGNLKITIEDSVTPSTSIPSLEGLIAHWSLDETGRTVKRDSHIGKHDLFPSGPISDAFGNIGGGVQFLGAATGSLVNYESVWSGHPPFSAYLWARVDADLINGKQLLGHFSPTGLASGWSIRLQNTVNRYGFRISNGVGGLRDVDHPSLITLGEWNLIVVTLDENLIGSIRVNNEPEVFSQMILPADPSIPLRIGTDELGMISFNGAIDEVGIFNRVLSLEEKNALWTGRTYPF